MLLKILQIRPLNILETRRQRHQINLSFYTWLTERLMIPIMHHRNISTNTRGNLIRAGTKCERNGSNGKKSLVLYLQIHSYLHLIRVFRHGTHLMMINNASMQRLKRCLQLSLTIPTIISDGLFNFLKILNNLSIQSLCLYPITGLVAMVVRMVLGICPRFTTESKKRWSLIWHI
ncbi:hypothetical protein D3C78_805240 [compost metagenome]